jgi:Domain of unknown function (DUF4345)
MLSRRGSYCVQVRALQIAVAILAFVPVAAGLAGALFGIGVFEPAARLGRDTDSTGRYLSGLLLAVGVAFWSTVPRIERQGVRFRLLTLIVLTGGLARLAGLLLIGPPSAPMLFGLAMELAVTPALALWRERLDNVCRGSSLARGAAPAA